MGQRAVIELLVTCVSVGMVQLEKSVNSVTFPTARDATLPLIQFNVHSVNLVIPLAILESVVCTYIAAKIPFSGYLSYKLIIDPLFTRATDFFNE